MSEDIKNYTEELREAIGRIGDDVNVLHINAVTTLNVIKDYANHKQLVELTNSIEVLKDLTNTIHDYLGK